MWIKLRVIGWNYGLELLVEYSLNGIMGTENDNRPIGLNPERKAMRERNFGKRRTQQNRKRARQSRNRRAGQMGSRRT
jgi:hypothetical protein